MNTLTLDAPGGNRKLVSFLLVSASEPGESETSRDRCFRVEFRVCSKACFEIVDRAPGWMEHFRHRIRESMDAVENIKRTAAGPAQGSRLTPGIGVPSLAAFPPELTGPRAGHRILLVDDDASFRDAQARLLRSRGYAVFEAPDGKEAERLFLRNHPDLIITDMSMPGRDGLETIRCLGEIDPLVPVIAMSGSGRLIRGDYLAFAHYLGAVRTLEKPFAFEELLAAVRVALPHSGGSLELAE